MLGSTRLRALFIASVVVFAAGGALASGCAVGGLIAGSDASIPDAAGITDAAKTCDAPCPSGQVCDNGACVSSCKTGELACSGQCVNPKTDSNHCGTCTTVCGTGLSCSNGQCVCTAPTTSCPPAADAGGDGGNVCVDTSKDMSNCGGCGNVCDDAGPNAVPTCASNVCTIGSCAANYGDCDKDAGDGCESNLNTDKNNCKACGTVCPPATPVCSNGSCTATLCGNGVIDTGEQCDGTTGVPSGGQITCWPQGSTDQCLFDFAQVPQLYCNGSCSWAGPQGCDQADADIFCKLLKGSSTSTATSFQIVTALAVGGFSCPTYGTNLGPMPAYGVSVNVWYQGTSILANHGAGQVITNAVCTP